MKRKGLSRGVITLLSPFWVFSMTICLVLKKFYKKVNAIQDLLFVSEVRPPSGSLQGGRVLIAEYFYVYFYLHLSGLIYIKTLYLLRKTKSTLHSPPWRACPVLVSGG